LPPYSCCAPQLSFFNLASQIAEAEGHHPDLHLTNYREVRVVLSTHAVGGLTLPDLVLAAKLDALPVEYSPKWLREREAAQASS
jgi:4a-hydroxytetrahydrobiopterin dehydratase